MWQSSNPHSRSSFVTNATSTRNRGGFGGGGIAGGGGGGGGIRGGGGGNLRAMAGGGGNQAQLMMNRQSEHTTEQHQQKQQVAISMADGTFPLVWLIVAFFLSPPFVNLSNNNLTFLLFLPSFLRNCVTAVLKDLRILEQQQKDSKEQLEQVRRQKQQRMKALESQEDALQQIQYGNGQDRARLQRMHEMLATVQRRLQTGKGHADDARRDLDNFDRQLQRALQHKRAVLACERRHQQQIQALRRQHRLAVHLRQEAQQQVIDAQEESNRIKQREATLQRELQEETTKNQAIQQETVKVRASSSVLEQEVADIQKEQAAKLQLIESLKKHIDNQDKSHNEKIVALDEQLSSQTRINDELRAKVQGKEAEVAKVKDKLAEHFQIIVEIQKAEGHETSQQQPSIQNPPVLDLDRIRESVRVEAKAAADEVAAKDELRVQYDSLCQELERVKHEVEVTTRKAAEKRKANEEASKKEQGRKDLYDKFFAEHAQIKSKHQDLTAKIPELQKKRDEVVGKAKKRAEVANESLLKAQEGLEQVKQETADIDTEMGQIETEYQDIFSTIGAGIDELKVKVKEAKCTFDQLEQEKERVKARVGPDLASKIQLNYGDLTVEEMETECENLITGK